MYRFSEVESVLMTLYGIGEDQKTAFRGRIKYFQRIGVAREKPGKGQKVTYDFADICLWALALELAEFGIEPLRIASAISSAWADAREHLVNDSSEEMLLVAYPYIMTFEIVGRQSSEDATRAGLFSSGLDHKDWVMPKRDLQDALGDRALVISLSRLRRRLMLALPD